MKILLLDIESAPAQVKVWSFFKTTVAINQVTKPGYTLCWSAKWLGGKEKFFSSLQHSTMDDMLYDIHCLLDESDAVVHYNGDKFDIPVLNKEFIKSNMLPPNPSHHIDLYKTVKNRFRFDSNKLDFVCRELGLGAKVQHKGMSLWDGCMDNDPKAWKTMETYNKQDVVLLEKLYKYMLPWLKNHPNHGLYLDSDRPVCTNCGSHNVKMNGTETTNTQVYQRYRCNSCGTPLRGKSTLLNRDKSKLILTQSKL